MHRPLFGLIACLCAALGCAANPDGSLPAGADAALEADSADGPVVIETGLNEATAVCIEGDAAVVVAPDLDWDHDGWSIAQGDCNDCDRNANPGAYDVAGNGLDEDCNGVADDELASCDLGLELPVNDAEDAARAIGLCRIAQANPSSPEHRTWGVLSAAWQLADQTSGMHYASHGVLPDFGPYAHAQEGASLLVLSTGTARRPGDPAYQAPEESNMGTTCATPDGWPKDSPSCSEPQSTTPIADDSAALALRIRVPTNARSLSFRFAFFTAEFPSWVCKQYNDFFVALLDSKAVSPKAQDGNICFDSLGNPISVNSAFLRACTPQVAGGHAFDCALGTQLLVGNGFAASDDEPRGHAGTGWLETTASVEPGEELTLRLLIWDGGDHLRTSTVLIDAFRWDAQPSTEPVTVPVDQPK
ncbi:MAG: putative metal-binding motif-containing protein [Deltaproteobacteria bacterium]|nr:putative metal-binding motif-containing protein [Deltaproteobacteria bacterium]